MEVNLEKLIKLVAKRAAQQVGPKLAKANNVRTVLESRVWSFKSKAANFIMDELYGTVGKILLEVEAEEAMLLFDPAASAAANLPPPSILLAGLLSPAVLTVSLFIHLSQVFLVLVPVIGMCSWAAYVDRNSFADCAVPTIWFWVYVQGGLALILAVAHVAITVRITLGKASIKEKTDSMRDRLREALSDGELTLIEMRELFIVSAILLEHSLVVEDGLRRSIWRQIIGYGTVAWMSMTVWTFVIVLGWTFIPGMVSFHIAEANSANFCGAWATVLTARLTCVVSLLFLMFNMISVVQFISDQLVTSESYSAAMISSAKAFDDSVGGIPIVQTIVKAFLLRGNGDSIAAQIAQSKDRSKALDQQREQLQAKIAALKKRIEVHKAEAAAIRKDQGIADDDLDAMEKALGAKGAAAAEEAMAQARHLEEVTKQEMQVMYRRIMEAARSLKESDLVQEALEKAKEAREAGLGGVVEAGSCGIAQARAAASSGLAQAKEATQTLLESDLVHAALEQAAETAAKKGRGTVANEAAPTASGHDKESRCRQG